MTFLEYTEERKFNEWLAHVAPELLIEGPFWGKRAMEPRVEPITVKDALEHPEDPHTEQMKSWITDALLNVFNRIFNRQQFHRMMNDLNRKFELEKKGQDFLGMDFKHTIDVGAGIGQQVADKAKGVVGHPVTQWSAWGLDKAENMIGVRHTLKMWLVDLPDTVIDFLVAGISGSKDAIWESFKQLFFKTPMMLGIMSASKLAYFMGMGPSGIAKGALIAFIYFYIYRICSWAVTKVTNKYGKAILNALIAPVPNRMKH